ATYNVLRAGLDARGAPVAWSHRLVGPAGGPFLLTRGADELIYPLPHFRLERATVDAGIPIGPWRGVGPSQNGWVVESFVDELAHAAGKDPYAYRRGRVAQSNFTDYRMLGLAETPEIEVHLVRSEAAPGGVGEAGLPPIAPAVCNAIFAGTGKRIRRLPIGRVA